MKKNRKSSIIILSLLAVLVIIMLVTGCSKGQNASNKQEEVPVVEEFSIEIGENEAVGGF